jgi:Flp pilus assembly pilin Flp
MDSFMKKVRRAVGAESVLSDERGLTTVEYVIILVLIAVLAITVWRNFGDAVKGQVDTSTNDINGLRSGNGTGTTSKPASK